MDTQDELTNRMTVAANELASISDPQMQRFAATIREAIAERGREPVAWLCEAAGFKSFTRKKTVADLWAKAMQVTPVFTTPPVPPSETDATDAVLAWMVAHGWLDADREYTAAEIITALDDNAGPAPPVPPSPSAGKWEIDHSTENPILTYEKCSVIQDEQAHYVMRLVEAAAVREPSSDDERFLSAYVSRDTKIIGIEHPTEADWNDVLAAHVALRDRLNVRIAEQEKCPFKPVIAEPSPSDDLVAALTDAEVKLAAIEFLSHKGERPYRITRRGAELWEDYAPAMRAALIAIRNERSRSPALPVVGEKRAGDGE